MEWDFHSINSRRTHVAIPSSLVAEIDKLVGKRGRSKFLVDAAMVELKRHCQLAAIDAATGAWKESDHPELKGGGLAYQKRLRAESEKKHQSRPWPK